MTPSSPLCRGHRVLALAAAFALTLAACGGSDGEDADAEVTTTSAAETSDTASDEAAAEATDDASDDAPADDTDDAASTDDDTSDDTSEDTSDDNSEAEDDNSVSFGACSASQAPNPEQVYSVSNIPADDPAGGLVARLLPGSSEQAIDVLVDGTIVDIFPGDECAVLANGDVWWFVNAPQLATGGFVNAAFLAGQTDLGQESDGVAGDGGDEDGFDVVLAQIDCVYAGSAESCDLLALFGIGDAEDNYGLGNAYSMAPAGFLAEDCLLIFEPLACAELEARGPGGDVTQIGTDYITAYQAGDAAGQQALSGERNTVEINSSDLTASQGEFGLASANFLGNEFSWTAQPSLSARCIVTGGLVQFCTVVGD